MKTIASILTKIIGVAMGLYLVAFMIPPALVQLSNDTALTGVDATLITFVQLVLPLLGTIGIAKMFFDE